MKQTGKDKLSFKLFFLIIAAAFVSFACNLPNMQAATFATEIPRLSTLVDLPTQQTPTSAAEATANFTSTPPLPTSFPLQVIEDLHVNDLFPYITQSGDTLPSLAARFQTTPGDITAENLSSDQLAQMSTLPPGQELMIRLIVEPIWDVQEQVIPNALYVNGPAHVDFDATTFINSSGGWLSTFVDRSSANPVTGAQIVESISQNYSISARLILALMEYHLGALSDPIQPDSFFLGSWDAHRSTLSRQLSWAANTLNNGFYGWREGTLTEFETIGGPRIVPSPWQNPASVALQYYFSLFSSKEETLAALSPSGLLQTYQTLFGTIDWSAGLEDSFIPGDLQQPSMSLPLQPGLRWSFTAGPHSGWGIGQPWAAIDFAPQSETAGCDASPYWALAMADGVIARSEGGVVVLDLDGDGKFQTGWTVFYLHIDPVGAPKVGTWVQRGDRIGHPSCVGGHSTGRNVHIARLYNGEWIPAGGTLAFNMDGWVVVQGESDYKGYLIRDGVTVYPSSLGEGFSNISAD